MKVAIVMGSESDWEVVKLAKETLDSLHVSNEVHVISAHRTPDKAREFALGAADSGIGVIIAAAGCAAHLAGAMAANTTIPVIGIPMEGGVLGGLDALLSTVQMPSGVPVATVGLGASGAKNAGVLAAQIIALNNKNIQKRLKEFKEYLAEKVKKMDENVKNEAAG